MDHQTGPNSEIGIHGPSFWSAFFKRNAEIHWPLNRSVFFCRHRDPRTADKGIKLVLEWKNSSSFSTNRTDHTDWKEVRCTLISMVQILPDMNSDHLCVDLNPRSFMRRTKIAKSCICLHVISFSSKNYALEYNKYPLRPLILTSFSGIIF